jgi:hypothetical protein
MLSSLFARLRSLVKGLLRRLGVESERDEEFRHHIDMRMADLLREAISSSERDPPGGGTRVARPRALRPHPLLVDRR